MPVDVLVTGIDVYDNLRNRSWVSVDLGDWQELSRLRSENHLWHRCLEDIVSAARNSQLTADELAEAIGSSVGTLNGRLKNLGRRPVACRAAARSSVGGRI